MEWLAQYYRRRPVMFVLNAAAVGFLILLVTYVGSIGPAACIASLSPSGHLYVAYFYRPLLIVRHNMPGNLADAIDFYIQVWSGDQCTWILGDFYRWKLSIDRS